MTGGSFVSVQYKMISASTPNRTSAMMPARRHAINWLRVCEEECHSDGGSADPGPIEGVVIKRS
jgi:hypothetical protein